MKNVAIITGGDSKEFDISLKSAETVYKNIDREKYNPFFILIWNKKWEIKVDNKLHEINSSLKTKVNGKELNFKDVFMVLHGPPAENGELQKSLEKNKIKYTENKNGVFINMNKLNNKTIEDLDKFIEYIRNNIKKNLI